MKLDLADIESTLRQQSEIQPQVITKILEDLKKVAKELSDAAKEEQEENRNKEKPYPVLIAMAGGPDAPLDSNNTPFFVVEPMGDVPHTEVVELIHKAAIAYNSNLLAKRGKKRKKHKKQPVENIGQTLMEVPATVFKSYGLKVRHRQLAICLPISNEFDTGTIEKLSCPDSNEEIVVVVEK